MERLGGTQPLAVGGDKGFDTFGFVVEYRHLRVTPHVAQNSGRRGGIGKASPSALAPRCRTTGTAQSRPRPAPATRYPETSGSPLLHFVPSFVPTTKPVRV